MQRQGWRFGNICRASALFYRMKTSFPYDKKRSARMALGRKGIVSLMRPAAGLRILRSRILFYRMKTSFPYDKKRSARIALGARADGCRSNRASARECAKAHSFLFHKKLRFYRFGSFHPHSARNRDANPCVSFVPFVYDRYSSFFARVIPT